MTVGGAQRVLAVLPRSALCIARLPDSCKSVRCWEPSLERRRGGKAAQNPDFLNCVEARRPAPPLRALHACRSACLATCLPHSQNGLGLRGALERRGCDFFTTDLKDGPDSGALHVCWLLSGAPLPPVRLRSRSLHMQTWTSCCRASTSSSPPPSTRCALPGLPPAVSKQSALLVSKTVRASGLTCSVTQAIWKAINTMGEHDRRGAGVRGDSWRLYYADVQIHASRMELHLAGGRMCLA